MKKHSTFQKKSGELWRRRLYLPCYQIKEAAQYTEITSQTIANWHREVSVFSKRPSRTELSYLELVEVAVAAAFRKAGITLKKVQEARDYLMKIMSCENPFAEYRFKTDGRDLLMNYEQIEKKGKKDKLINLNQKGQLGWKAIIEPLLSEFEYEKELAIRWNIGKRTNSSVIIDPQVCYGAPSVSGTPTWVVKGRWEAGESMSDIACDFHLKEKLVKEALLFEKIQPDTKRHSLLTCN